jgi:hypothetical protein
MLNILKDASKRQEGRRRPIKERLMERIFKNPSNGCWEWQGYKMSSGHGRIGYRDKVYLTHRISYEIYVGSIPDGMQVNHHCDNGCCVNPEHLFIGTQKDNMTDCKNKKRNFRIPAMRGEKNPLAQLTNEQAKEIRKKLAKGITGIKLAKEYNISTHVISRINTGRTYKEAI